MDNFNLHQFAFWAIICLILGFKLFKRFGFWAASLTLYCLFSSLVLFQIKIDFYDHFSDKIRIVGAETFAKLIAFSFMALAFYKWRKYWARFFELFILLNCIIVIIKGYGFFNASSFDAAIIACSIPFIWLRPDWKVEKNLFYLIASVLLPIVAIIRTGQSATAYFILLGILIAYAFKKKIKTPFIFAFLIFLIAFYFNGEMLFNSSRRVEYWKEVFSWHDIWISKIYGSGIGSFEWLGPLSQINITGRNSGLTLQMHNEFLNLYYEGGFVGLFLGVMVWAEIGIKSYLKSNWEFLTFAALSVCMLSYHPLHFSFSEFFILAFACEVLWKE